jgi:hypothetical protein
MSAQLAAAAASSNNFSAHLQLADGATASIHAPTLTGLRDIVAKLQPTEAVNDPVAVKPAATPAPAPTAAPQAQPEGNASASTGTQASAQAAAGGSAPSADTPTYTYDQVAQRVKDLCKKPGGREKCLALLATFKGVSGDKVDHGNKLQLADYASFIAQADKLIGARREPRQAVLPQQGRGLVRLRRPAGDGGRLPRHRATSPAANGTARHEVCAHCLLDTRPGYAAGRRQVFVPA